ncbi:hypothetical protein QBC40DRAFT_276912 [Triangularia verruculosa]|uniref:Uncharacterized protein n=1 Tax=Triangularia verruculosa TaxID=2587418 RepID=A0AAN6XL01_9PEZI|nr:hypothetical protein QBC40DRAFT_276912 [Triangularia verruculosa]
MRVTSLFLTGALAILASAQGTSTTVQAQTSIDPATAAQNSQQAAIIACINACKPGDVNCTAKCNPVPNPGEQDVEATNKCVSECPKGNGTEADNLAYGNCYSACVAAHYYTATPGVAPQPTGGSSSGNGNSGNSGNNNNNNNNSGDNDDGENNDGGDGTTNNQEGSPTTTGAPAGVTTNAAVPGAVVGSGMGLLAFLGAVMAL